ncbi:MAG: LacI family transcriptional regulator [Treponema sp.]|nr:LacI family transcriptional regulator [Treponema sp.]
MITIKEIAERAGVSATTVSNVLHGNTSHTSADTIEKVKKIIKVQNYVPNMGAMILAHSFSKIIGVILQYTTRGAEKTFMDPFEGELLSSLEEEIRRNGYYTMLYVATSVSEVIALAATWKIDGLIIIGLQPDECGLLRSSTTEPVVFVDCYFNHDSNEYYNVGLADREGSRAMTNYLISMGHKDIAFLADSNNPRGVDRERLEGVRQAFQEHSLEFSEKNFISISRDENKRHRILDTLAAAPADYTALFFSSDYYAFDALTYFVAKNIRVPEDYSLAGFDDNVFSRAAHPKITTVHQDVSQKGALAVQMLLKLIRKESVPENNIKLPTSLITRESTGKNPNK